MQDIPRPASFDGFPTVEENLRKTIQMIRYHRYKYITKEGVENLLNDCLRRAGLPEEPR